MASCCLSRPPGGQATTTTTENLPVKTATFPGSYRQHTCNGAPPADLQQSKSTVHTKAVHASGRVSSVWEKKTVAAGILAVVTTILSHFLVSALRVYRYLQSEY